MEEIQTWNRGTKVDSAKKEQWLFKWQIRKEIYTLATSKQVIYKTIDIEHVDVELSNNDRIIDVSKVKCGN